MGFTIKDYRVAGGALRLLRDGESSANLPGEAACYSASNPQRAAVRGRLAYRWTQIY